MLALVRHRVGWVVVLALLALGGTACQSAAPTINTPVPLLSPTPTAAAPVPTATAAPPVRLTLNCRCVRDGANHNLVQWLENDVAPAFEADMEALGRPVTLQVVPFDGTDEEHKSFLQEQLSAGTGADLIFLDGFWIPELVAADLLDPLENVAGPSMAEWEGWDHISPGLRGLLSYRGQLYGIALGTDTRAIFYRTDLFEQAGITLPWQPRSWEEVLETARILKATLPEVAPLQVNAGTAMGEATTMQGYLMLLLGAGSHLYDFEQQKWIVRSSAMLNTLKFYESVYQTEGLGSLAFQMEPDGRERSFEAFRDGEVAMLIESDYLWRSVLAPGSFAELPNRDGVVGWAKMPAIEPGAGYNEQDFVTISGGGGVSINPHTEHPVESWELLQFMFSQRMLLAFQEIEPRLRVRNDVPVVGDEVMTEMSQTLLPLTTVRPTLPEYPRVSAQVQLMTERVVSGQMSPEAAMEAYALSVKAIVGPENTRSLP